MNNTLETDKAERMACSQEYMVPTEFARKLEFERDETMEKINNIHNILSKNGEAIGNGDYSYSIIEMVENLLKSKSFFIRKSDLLQSERDEARDDLEFRRDLYKVQKNYLELARRERDEAREDQKNSRQSLEVALEELTEAREEAHRFRLLHYNHLGINNSASWFPWEDAK